MQVCGSVYGCDSPCASEEGAVGTEAAPPDLAAVRALLREGGHDGRPVVIPQPGNLPALAAYPLVAGAAPKAIGMRVEVQAMDWAAMLQRLRRPEPPERGGWSLFRGGFHRLDLADPLVNPLLEGRGRGSVPGSPEDAEMEALHDAFAREADPARRRDLAHAVQRRSYGQVFFAPLGSSRLVRAGRDRLRGMVVSRFLVFWGMGA